MIRVLNLIHSLTGGGAARTMLATAKYSTALGGFQHSVAALNLQASSAAAFKFAADQGVAIPVIRNREELYTAIAETDIVLVSWWQHPEMDTFFRSELPSCRLVGWFHCAGDYPPQVVSTGLVDICDLVLGGSPYTHEAPAIQRLPDEIRNRKTGYVTGGADFERLEEFVPKPHPRFTVGYIGTVNYIKMHRSFLKMHYDIKVPDLNCVVCGGEHHERLAEEARQAGFGERFDFRGYVEDIGSVLAECDVYGYPLCEETYAASELNLQEAMYCGIPPVVFPHGGIKRLVIHNETGLVVHSEKEYTEAIEYLFRNPLERKRLGENARNYASINFGARNNAPKLNQFLTAIMEQPKRTRKWSSSLGFSAHSPTGTQCFLESLDSLSPEFTISYESRNLSELLSAEEKIRSGTELMRLGGVLPFQGHYPNDPYLQLWSGIMELGAGRAIQALSFLLESLKGDLPLNGRILYYISEAAEILGDRELAAESRFHAEELHPELTQIRTTR